MGPQAAVAAPAPPDMTGVRVPDPLGTPPDLTGVPLAQDRPEYREPTPEEKQGILDAKRRAGERALGRPIQDWEIPHLGFRPDGSVKVLRTKRAEYVLAPRPHRRPRPGEHDS